MNNITLQECSIRWRISYILVFALAHLLTALHILAVLLTRRKKRKVSGQRSPLLQDSRAFLYLFVFGCIAAVIPSVVLLLLAPRYVKPGLDLYVIHFGLYFTLSGEVCRFTRDLKFELILSAVLVDPYMGRYRAEMQDRCNYV